MRWQSFVTPRSCCRPPCLPKSIALALFVGSFIVALKYSTTRAALMPRLLCLHGKGETGADFARRLEPIRSRCPGVELVCVDAPHALGGGFAWWHLPPGERSFTSSTFQGWDQTVSYIQDVWTKQGPFDGMLGFSQGAILLAALAALGLLGEKSVIQPRVLMLYGSAVPGPFKRELAARSAALQADPGAHISYRALHVLSKNDEVNPPEGAREVATAMGGQVLEHSGGHEVPLDEASLAAYSAFLSAAAVADHGHSEPV
ncbi:unnamed protein product [Polarella glacialis]|uniref:Serine hydrolase domain-containing protein n=1 Tax=Polarella glacialis TaxID=89957 RepID=A0A813JER5_POLGL|nr:unnamed protein product [Polarella glacialis]